ncbi:MAG: TVP38/TMEM64 family protein [Acidobacteriota bacterium]
MKRKAASAHTNRKDHGSSVWKWIGLGVAAVALFAAWRLLPLADWLRAFQDWIGGMGVLGGVVFGLAYVVAALLFVPGAALTLAAGLAFGIVWGTVVVSIASTMAAALAFLIARYAARERIQKLARGNARFAAIDKAIGENGWKVVGLLRLSPVVPFSLSNYLYGLTSVRFLPYLLASWIGMLPGTILYVAIGAAGHGSSKGKSPIQWIFLGAGVLATAAVSIWLARVARKELKKKKVGSH